MSPPKDTATGERIKVGGLWVEYTTSGRAFTVKKARRVDGLVTDRRVYGEVYACALCGHDYFRRQTQQGAYCSNRCSKRGDLNPTRKRPQKNAAYTCDKLFSLIVRRRGRCLVCGDATNLQCAHGFSRRYRAIRWDERNAFPLCRKCHMYYTHRPLEWDVWLREQWGEDTYEDLRRLALAGERPDLSALLISLRATWAAVNR